MSKHDLEVDPTVINPMAKWPFKSMLKAMYLRLYIFVKKNDLGVPESYAIFAGSLDEAKAKFANGDRTPIDDTTTVHIR